MVDPRSNRFLVVFCFMLHVRVLLFLSLSQSLFSCVFFLLLILFLNVFNAVNLSLLFSPVFNHQSHSIFMRFLSPPQNNMAHKLKILSLNVRGLRNTNKRRAIFSYLRACLHGVGDPGLGGLVSFVFTLWRTQNKRNLPH